MSDPAGGSSSRNWLVALVLLPVVAIAIDGLVRVGFVAGVVTLVVIGPVYFVLLLIGGRGRWRPVVWRWVGRSLLGLAVLLFAAVLRLEYMVFASIAEGMEWDSPDGRYNAECWAGTEVGFFGGERDYVRYRIVERASGKEVVRTEESLTDASPQLHVREDGAVRWATDSKRVIFHLREGLEREFTVP